jgi:hypothetical protein
MRTISLGLAALVLVGSSAAGFAAQNLGGGTGGLWCACKLNCDNDYSGNPVLIRACKEQCDKDNKCRTSSAIVPKATVPQSGNDIQLQQQ